MFVSATITHPGTSWTIKEDHMEQLVLDAFDRAIEILEMDSQTQREETFREFIIHWAEKSINKLIIYINLPNAATHEFHEYTAIGPTLDSLLISQSIDESKGFLIEKKLCKSDEVEKIVIPCLRIRLRASMLPRFDRDITWKDIRSYISENITVGQRRLFKQLLATRPEKLNRLLLIQIPSQYGDQYACLWLNWTNTKHEALGNTLNCKVDPVIAIRIDAQYLLARGGAESEIVDKKVLLIGCGSVGGFLADNLCQCGIGTLDILDRDQLSIDNVYRHVLGFNSAIVGENKADLMKKHLEDKFPYVEIDSLSFNDRSVEKFLEEPDRMLGYDIIVSATGNPTADLAINDVLRRMVNAPPLVVCFNEPYGIGGHVVAALENGGCLRCLYTDPLSGELTSFQGSFVEPGQDFSKTLSGCAGSYVEYSVLDSQQTALIACRLIIDVLKGNCCKSRLVSWVGDPKWIRHAGYTTSKYYERLERDGKSIVMNDISNVHGCRTCQA